MSRASPFLISSLIVFFDQATKYLVRQFIEPFRAIEVFPFLHLVNIRNKGAAFGLFRDLGNSFFVVFSLTALVALSLLLLRGGMRPFGRLCLALVLGGAAGNLIDRVFMGSVIDFIDFFIDRYHWPAFNVADSAITIGLVMLLFSSEFKLRPDKEREIS
jgi:signal peptidase II